ncbi:multicopper oxidase 1 [Teratosphaeria destructans]|uniref:Multicopper oxidase 1 n=1 Tax=Teratosphaeria destructans TaxID=418781 RepID=A0A9W7SN77_9PEZI|nr:multicopper oxidase 1 [Teratosphaeria destructans]
MSSDSQDVELSEDYSRPGVAEQEQGLLGGWKQEQDRADDVRSKPRRRSWSWAPWIAMTLAVVLALLAVLAFILGLGSCVKQHVEGDLSVHTNDYILDPRWDYDAPAQRREYTFTIRDQIHNPDGFWRPMILVNNQFPGPLLEVNQGDTIVVHVDNQGVNATSIHWHGIYQNGTPHMDGTVGITQCPIAPGSEFTYEFTVSEQSGTYWWHGHYGLQASDGMYGPLIIHARNEKEMQKIDYDTDRVVLVSDHYQDLSSALLWQYLKPDAENTEPIPDSGLINGRGRVDCKGYANGTCDNSTAHLGPVTFDLAPNQNHRLRFINVGAFAEFQVQIDEHELAVTEVDGTTVEPVNFHRINISPAQRYSVVVSTRLPAEGAVSDTFWLRARMNTFCFKEKAPHLDPDIMAIVRYNVDSTALPMSIDWGEKLNLECKDLDTTALKPVEAMVAPAPDAYFYVRANFEIGAMRLSRGVFNSSSWRSSPFSPSLLRSMDGLAELNTSFSDASVSYSGDGKVFVNDAAFDTSRELVIQTRETQVIDLLISNFDDGNHPLHLHGYKYFVLAQGHGYPPKKDVLQELTRENVQPLYDTLDLSNPLRRDTASVEGYGWILIRVVADNPGMWALHCHVSWHTEAGLLMQFLTLTDELAKMEIPAANAALCAAEGIERGMGPADEDYRELAK